MTNWELMAQARDLFEKYSAKLGVEGARICFTETKSWGKAYWGKEWLVDINLNLHRRHPEELEDTIVHEIAHLSVAHKIGKHTHQTPAWKDIMIKYGFSAKATHKSYRAEAIVGV